MKFVSRSRYLCFQLQREDPYVEPPYVAHMQPHSTRNHECLLFLYACVWKGPSSR